MNQSTYPAVSIVVPNYNHAPYLEQRIESILAQTYQNFELILLDDCSTDNSVDILNRYRSHAKVSHVEVNEVNSGTTFKQWAKGIELARHEWVWLAESDDWCEPTLLETLVEGLTDSTCIAFCQSVTVRDNDILYVSSCKHFRQLYNGYEFVRAQMLRSTAISNASQAIFRKVIYYQIDKDFTTYKFSGDWLFWMLVAQHGDVYIVGKYLNYFRKHSKDVTSPSLKNGMAYREYLRTLDKLQALAVISADEKVDLLVLKFNELLWDNRVEKAYVDEISVLYYEKLGNKLLRPQSYRLMGKRSFLKVVTYQVLGRR